MLSQNYDIYFYHVCKTTITYLEQHANKQTNKIPLNPDTMKFTTLDENHT